MLGGTDDCEEYVPDTRSTRLQMGRLMGSRRISSAPALLIYVQGARAGVCRPIRGRGDVNRAIQTEYMRQNEDGGKIYMHSPCPLSPDTFP